MILILYVYDRKVKSEIWCSSERNDSMSSENPVVVGGENYIFIIFLFFVIIFILFC